MRVLIADDEPLARHRLRRLLREEPDAEVVAECASGREAADALRRLAPELVFLDVQMPDADGFTALAEAAAVPPAVVFVTAHDQYAVRAFEVGALDYLLKPFDAERLRQAVTRARARLRAATTVPAVPPAERTEPGWLTRVLVRDDGRVLLVRTADVDWVEADGNYLRLHVGRDVHHLRETMAAFEARLDPARFLRVHRSTIVQVDRIRELQPWFSGEWIIILRDGTRLKLSRGYREHVERRLGQAL